MTDVATTAAYFHYAILLGIVERSAVSSWLDNIIASSPAPPAPAVLEAALATDDAALVTALGHLEPTADYGSVKRALFSAAAEAVRKAPATAAVLCERLYLIATLHALPVTELELHLLVGISDELHLASSGTHGSVQSALNEFVGFLVSAGQPEQRATGA